MSHSPDRDARRQAPAAARNRGAILDVLRRHLPARGLVLEFASGTGEHIAHLAAHLASAAGWDLVFQPSDPDPEARASIDAWSAALGLARVRPAIDLDAASTVWPIAHADAVVCINMIHIAPWSAAEGLVAGAARILPAAEPASAAGPATPGGLLYLYGPFRQGGRHTSPGNARFDADLRQQNALWGVRDLEAVARLAAGAGFAPPLIEPMPANNLSVVFRKLGGARAG